MSFTAEVKDELSRVAPACETCDYAELAAMVRVCGTLSFKGSGRFSLYVSTETGSVARTVYSLIHKHLNLNTLYTPRRSRLHRVRNHLIELPEQDGLDEALTKLGILLPDRGLAPGIPMHLLERDCCQAAFIRGAFMAGGFIADPRGDFHLEIAATGEAFATELAELISGKGIRARLNHRRGAYVIYVKSFNDVLALLKLMGAARTALAVERVRAIKAYRNTVNRQTNADMANSKRTADAVIDQIRLIERAEKLVGLSALPRAVREFCVVRLDNPGLSLADLGAEMVPPVSKSAMYHRYLRLQALVKEAEAAAHDSSATVR